MALMSENSTAPASFTHWQPVAGLDRVWEIRRVHRVMPLRAVAVQLRPDWVCVYSPVPHIGDGALRELRALGSPILLAPNAFHTLGLREHASAFPSAQVVASVQASRRIQRKTGLPITDLSVLEPKLATNVSLLALPPLRSGEVWLSVRSASACGWIVCDGFLNLQRAPRGLLGLIVKALRMGPGLSISSSFRWMIKNRKAYREWLLARIAEDRPTILVPSHGQIVQDPELPQRLERLVRERV
jgi:hypothetical protein